MSELPGRPNLDQLRHQARDLLRAATGGDPAALTRLRAVSEQVTLAAAQLALAREYGLASWPALHAEVERRLADLAIGADGTGPAGPRWSFGGAAAIETAAGRLLIGGLVAGPAHAALEVSAYPSGEDWPTRPDPVLGRHHLPGMNALAEAIVGFVTLTDDLGTAYTLQNGTMSARPPRHEQEGWLLTLSLEIAPIPARERGWLELRGQDGSVARLMPSPRPDTRVTRLAPVPDSPAGRELSELALRLIRLHLIGDGREDVQLVCTEALARVAEIQQSGASGAVAERCGQLTRLCAFMLGHGPADSLPREWSSMINAAHQADGAQRHVNIAAVLPSVADTVVSVDSLHSEPETWKIYVHSSPGWGAWGASQAGRPELSIDAQDDLGGRYLSAFAGSSGRKRSGEPGDPGDPGHNEDAELCFRFHPRLDPLARALTLIFRRGAEAVTVELRLP